MRKYSIEVIKDNKKTIKSKEAELMFIINKHEEEDLFESDKEKELLYYALNKILDILKPRERQVIEMRMGLGQYDRVYTLDEVGRSIPKGKGYDYRTSKMFAGENVSRARVGQIEAKALRKLRHPKIISMLKTINF